MFRLESLETPHLCPSGVIYVAIEEVTKMTVKGLDENLTKEIVSALYEHGLIRTFFRDKKEGWKLVSGLYSPLYIQLRPLVSYPNLFAKVCAAMTSLLSLEAPQVTKIVGIAMAGIPLAAGMAALGSVGAAYTRKLDKVRSLDSLETIIKEYGEHSMLEGDIESNDCIALVDDLVTKFDSKLIALGQVQYEMRRRNLGNIVCRHVAVVLDREQGGKKAAESHGMTLLSLVPFKTVGLPLLKDVMDATEWDVLTRYLDDPEEFQDAGVQSQLHKISKSL
jgi:orotate phosphoribosyltransferase